MGNQQLFQPQVFFQGKRDVQPMLKHGENILCECEVWFLLPKRTFFGYAAITETRLLFSSTPRAGANGIEKSAVADISLKHVSNIRWLENDEVFPQVASLTFEYRDTVYRIALPNSGSQRSSGEEFKLKFLDSAISSSKIIENSSGDESPVPAALGFGLQVGGKFSHLGKILLVAVVGVITVLLIANWPSSDKINCGSIDSSAEPFCQRMYDKVRQDYYKDQLKP